MTISIFVPRIFVKEDSGRGITTISEARIYTKRNYIRTALYDGHFLWPLRVPINGVFGMTGLTGTPYLNPNSGIFKTLCNLAEQCGIKDGASVIAPTVTFLVNLSFSTGIVPCDWKMARVVPLDKSGGHANMDNYRPISILPVMSKIMEKAVNVQLQRHLQRFDLLSPFRAGFRQHHSTESALLYFTDEIIYRFSQC